MPQGGNFDPNNMPDGFDSENMPDGFNPGSMQSGDSGNGQGEKSDADAESSATIQGENSQGDRGSMANMGDFSPMGGQSKTDTKTSVIMLAVSVIILLGGLGFAFEFKR